LRSKWEGGEQGRGRKRAEKWRTARLGASSLWHVERPSFLWIENVRRVERPRGFGRNQGRGRAGGAGRARRVAGGLDSAGAEQGREGEKRE